ncbi:hypothetical protein CCR75_005496 [Bremia lactucae]|uniref:Vacuolar protein sorting-associated protein 54 n=1 Tax=Bremia lactucae TaxID=4779 RepID=A0A976IGH2_BRELC|nr:hypothetical protein CCR75_005496 [Bremia lactucae]
MEKRHKKPLETLSPRKHGWIGFTSPIDALKAPPSSAAASRSKVSNPSGRMTSPSPNEYPSLFDVRGGPSSTRSVDGMSARECTSKGSGGSSGWSDRIWLDERLGVAKGGEEQAHRSVYHHNLHSVLTNPKASSWGGTLLDAFYPMLDVDVALASPPGLTDVTMRDFQPYLREFGTNATKYEKNHLKPVSKQLSSSNVPPIFVADEDVLKCLKDVPYFFFRPDFDLADPSTFEKIMNLPKALSLEDELTAYLDGVEFALLRQVASRSDQFFEASADQEVMKQSIQSASEQVANLRKTMKRLRHLVADKTLDIVNLHRRQKRMKDLHRLVTMVEEVKSAEAAVEALVQCQDYTNALNLIESSQTILKVYLQGIHGLSSLNEKFKGYLSFMSAQISRQFISVITSPEWTFQDEGDSNHIDKNKANSLRYKEDNLLQESKHLVDLLFRLDALDSTVKTYLDQLNEEIRMVVKTVVTETIAVSKCSVNSCDSDIGALSGNESKISNQLRALTSDDFFQCVQMLFEHLLLILKRAVVVQGILVESMQKRVNEATDEENRLEVATFEKIYSYGTDHLKASKLALSEGWPSFENFINEDKRHGDWNIKNRCAKVIRDIDEVIRNTCELSQRNVSNLFAVRKEIQAIYTLPQLRKLYDTTMDFVISIEKLTGKTDYTLRGALFSQLKLFLETYHKTQVTKLVATLDRETWKSTEISEMRHKALDDLSSGRGVALVLTDDRTTASESATPLKMVSICGKSFRVVWSVLLMLEIAMNYMSCAANFPVLATDVLQRSIEMFRLYNSRTTQLVLGAGAMQMAHLKSISARHLALASQSLELCMTLIPHIKAALAANFTDRQKLLLDEFDRVLRDYAEHNEKIFSKFTSIVEDQIMKRFLENVDYDSDNLAIPTTPMRGITHSTLKLHAVLHPILSSPQMKDVMSRVFDMFTQKLPECFKLVQPRTAAGKNRVLDDIGAFVQSYKEVAEVSFDGDALLNLFKRAYNVS